MNKLFTLVDSIPVKKNKKKKTKKKKVGRYLTKTLVCIFAQCNGSEDAAFCSRDKVVLMVNQ